MALAVWHLILTVCVAALGGMIGRRLKLPAGTMLGALLFTVLYNLLFERAYVPADFRPWMQILSGILLGAGIQRRDVRELRHLVVPSIIMIVDMVILNLIFGLLIYRFSSLDLATSLLATAPGGMSDMALIAADLGGQSLPVTLLHLVRQLSIFILLPLLLPWLRRQQTAKGKCLPADTDMIDDKSQDANQTTAIQTAAIQTAANRPAASQQFADQSTAKQTTANRHQTILNSSLTLATAVAGGVLFWQLGINAGAMIGSMLAVAALNLATGRAQRSTKLRIGIQVVAGAFVGQSMTRNNLSLMIELMIPVLLMILSVLVYMAVVSLTLIWLSKLNRTTCMLVSAPGGLQEISLMAEDLSADAPKVMVLQTTRLMTVIALFPTLLSFVIDGLN